jgi:hypothetical protein
VCEGWVSVKREGEVGDRITIEARGTLFLQRGIVPLRNFAFFRALCDLAQT